MIRLALFLLLLLSAAAAQDVPLGDVARANKEKKADPAKPVKKDAGAARAKPRVFTNDEVSSRPATTAGTTEPAASAPRKQKAGLTLKERNRLSGKIGYLRGMLIAQQREAAELAKKPERTEAESKRAAQLEEQIKQSKYDLAVAENELYE